MRLSKVLHEYRWATRKSVRQLAGEIGIPFTTFNRFERSAEVLNGET